MEVVAAPLLETFNMNWDKMLEKILQGTTLHWPGDGLGDLMVFQLFPGEVWSSLQGIYGDKGAKSK